MLNHVLRGDLTAIFVVRYDEGVVLARDPNVTNHYRYVRLVRFVDNRRQCCWLDRRVDQSADALINQIDAPRHLSLLVALLIRKDELVSGLLTRILNTLGISLPVGLLHVEDRITNFDRFLFDKLRL